MMLRLHHAPVCTAGESPEGSPQLRQRRAMNPEVSEKESLALVGLTDAEEEHGHGGKRSVPWSVGQCT